MPSKLWTGVVRAVSYRRLSLVTANMTSCFYNASSVPSITLEKLKQPSLDVVVQLAATARTFQVSIDAEQATDPLVTSGGIHDAAGQHLRHEVNPGLDLAAKRLAGVVWVSNLYRTVEKLEASDVKALASVVVADSEEWKDAEDILSRFPDMHGLKTIKSRSGGVLLPDLPLLSSRSLYCSRLAQEAVNLCTITIALTVEMARVSPKIFEPLSASCHKSIAQVASSVQWLLDESKLQQRKNEDINGVLGRSCVSLAQLQANAQVLKNHCLTDLKNYYQSSAAALASVGSFVSIGVLEAPRVTVDTVMRLAVSQAVERMTLLSLPILRIKVKEGRARKEVEWPKDMPRPSELPEVPPQSVTDEELKLVEDALESVRGDTARDGGLEQTCVRLIRALSLELSILLVGMEEEKIDAYYGAVAKALKKKKNASAKVHWGKPLMLFSELFWAKVPVVDSQPNRIEAIFRTLKSLQLLECAETFTRVLTATNQGARRPKIAKGCLDATPRRMLVRRKVFSVVTNVFQRYGAVPIDTPIFELKETLTGKYGEDQKLIYDLKDQGGEQLSLRYDLTVPFARYIATQNVEKIKRYHIGKVYRRDEPQMARGRFREFFQCDFDIAGDYQLAVPDAEVLSALVDILTQFRDAVGAFVVKLNHRLLLDAIMEVCGVPVESLRAISSAIDKLDKLSWTEVKHEMCSLKGLKSEIADTLEPFVGLRGPPSEVLATLRQHADLATRPGATKALDELEALCGYLTAAGTITPIELDMSLARGLDYYTGVIFEAVLTETHQVGSVAAGGRYNNLVGMFSGKQVPAVGVSIGVERLFRVIETNLDLAEGPPNSVKKEAIEQTAEPTSYNILVETPIDVFVCSIGEFQHRIKIAKQLRDGGIAADYVYQANAKLGKQLQHANDLRVSLVVIFGSDELQRGCVTIRKFDYSDTHPHTDVTKNTDDQSIIEVSLSKLVETVRNQLHETESAAARADNLIMSSHQKGKGRV